MFEMLTTQLMTTIPMMITMMVVIVMTVMKCVIAEWLLEAYRRQWLAMLQIDSGVDVGFVSLLMSL